MLLAIDVGNTNSVFSVSKDKKILSEWRCSTDGNMTADQYFTWLQQLFSISDIKYKDINKVIVSSVVPDSIFNLKVLSKTYFNCSPLIVGSDNCKIPISIDVERGVNVGADRLVNATAAYHIVGGDTIIVDFGTATTFDVINDLGSYIGGVIAPGVSLSTKALHEAAAALPHIEVKRPPNVVGRNTINCMQSGIYWGYLSLVDGIISKIKNERKIKNVIATGGLSTVFSRDTSMFDKIDLRLTIKGLVYISSFNEDK
jgi:type III pantothenate kinase